MIPQAQELANGAVAVATQTKEIGLGDMIISGGWLMIPLAILLGVTIFIFVERYKVISKAAIADVPFMNKIREYVLSGNYKAAKALCRKANSPLSRMIDCGIDHLDLSITDINKSIENCANLEVSKLENNLSFLATIAGGAPMIGFLGTVLGMVEAFMNLSQVEGGGFNMALLSSGMYTAMVTTVAGLVVGIPAYFGYNYLVQRVDKVVFQMEANTIAFIDILQRGK
ncbi:MAG: MotA/TolQ/ExbB proton channel family protein [Rikenellaceae bacterium]